MREYLATLFLARISIFYSLGRGQTRLNTANDIVQTTEPEYEAWNRYPHQQTDYRSQYIFRKKLAQETARDHQDLVGVPTENEMPRYL
jgi:hypothetical protein